MASKERLTIILGVCTFISLVLFFVNKIDGAIATPGPVIMWGFLVYYAFKQKYQILKVATAVVIAITAIGLIFFLVPDNQQINSLLGVNSLDIFITGLLKLGVLGFVYYQANELNKGNAENFIKEAPEGVGENKVSIPPQAYKANNDVNIEAVSTERQSVKDNGREGSSRDSQTGDEVLSTEDIDAGRKRAHDEYSRESSSIPLSELVMSDKWLMLERYNPKSANILNELEGYGEAYQAMFVEGVINRRQNQDLDAIKELVVSGFNHRFTISERSEINDSLKKIYILYGDEAVEAFIDVYSVVGDELDIEKLEADLSDKQEAPDLDQEEQVISPAPLYEQDTGRISVGKEIAFLLPGFTIVMLLAGYLLVNLLAEQEKGLGRVSSLTDEPSGDVSYSPQNAEIAKFDKAYFLREMSSANSPYQSWKVRYAIIQGGLKDNVLELSGGFMWEVSLVQASEFIGKREVLSGQEVLKLEEFNTWWLDGDVVDGYRMSITLANQSKQTINSVMVSIHETCEDVVQSYAMLDLSETLIKGDFVVHDFALPSVIGSSFSCVKIIAAK